MTSFMDRAINQAPALFVSVQNAPPSALQSLKRRALYAAFNWLVSLGIPFTSRNRFRVVAIGPGTLKAAIPMRGNRNHMGTMYAGAMFLLAEIPGGVMALFEFGSGYVPVLKEMTITYLQLAKTDLTIEFSLSREFLDDIREKADRDGKSDFTLTAELLDASGTAVARTVGHYQLRKRSNV